VSAGLVELPAELPEDALPEDALPEDAVLAVDEDPDADAVEEVDDAVVSPALSVMSATQFHKRPRKKPLRKVLSGGAT
jgi:hypothetical protein